MQKPVSKHSKSAGTNLRGGRPPVSLSSTREGRETIAQDTITLSKSIIEEHTHEGATANAIFYSDQLPILDSGPNEPKVKHPVQIINADAFTVARNLLKGNTDAKGSIAVLNLASDARIAGGWLKCFSKTQEEALCYSSTLYLSFRESWYPWPNLGPGSVAGAFSPGVVVFKNDLDNNCSYLPKDQRIIVSVITVAAPRRPKLTADKQQFAKDSDLEDLKGKIRLIYRMAVHHKQRYLILGAMGCGAYACPPKAVAQEMKNILLDPEFESCFDRVLFAVYSKSKGRDDGNYTIFKDIFAGVQV